MAPPSVKRPARIKRKKRNNEPSFFAYFASFAVPPTAVQISVGLPAPSCDVGLTSARPCSCNTDNAVEISEAEACREKSEEIDVQSSPSGVSRKPRKMVSAVGSPNASPKMNRAEE